MPEFFTNYSAAIPKQTSLADMIGNMSALQKYNQETQLLPIQLERAKAELQTSQQGAEKGGIELSQSKQANQERLAVQNAITQNPERFQTNGRFDVNKLMQQLPTLAPMTHTDYLDRYTKAIDSAAKAESSIGKLSEDRRGIIGSTVSALGHAGVNDPKIVVRALDQLKKHHKGDEAFSESVDAFADMFKNAQPGAHISQTAILTGNMLLGPSEQQQLFAPKSGTQALGNVIQPTVNRPSVLGENPTLAASGQPFQMGLSPSQREEVSGTDTYGNPISTVKNVQGEVVGQRGVPVIGQNAPAPAPIRLRPGESPDTVKAFQTERQMAKDSAAAAAPALLNIQTVRKYLPLAATGANSEAIAKLQSVVGNIGGSKPEELAAAARDIIEKSINDLALQKNQALGGRFVEDLKGASQSLASAGKNPTAIAKSMDQLEPLIQHAQLYQRGLENAINKAGGDVQVKRQFDNAMIDAYDPQALMAYNAYKSGGKDALAKAVFGKSDAKKAEIFNKMEQYNKLVKGEL
jgi:hypothetical protein